MTGSDRVESTRDRLIFARPRPHKGGGHWRYVITLSRTRIRVVPPVIIALVYTPSFSLLCSISVQDGHLKRKSPWETADTISNIDATQHPALWKQPAPANSAFNDYNTFPLAQTQRHNTSSHHGPVSHTQQPLVTGTSVLGIKFDKGVMIAADNLGSYGSLARFRDIQRLHPLGKHTLLGVAGDMSDYQWLKKELDGLLYVHLSKTA